MLKKTVSDSLAKNQCKGYLESLGFKNLHPARGNSCDLIGYKNNKHYYFEIKYSSKSQGDFFGCVMFTELFQALSNQIRKITFLLYAEEIEKIWIIGFIKFLQLNNFLNFAL